MKRILHYAFDTTDDTGKTLVDFFLIPTGSNARAMITFGGSEAERTKHQDEIVSIMNSVKPAK